MNVTASELTTISKNWAQDRTLAELRDKVSTSNKLLAKIADVKQEDLANLQEFNDALGDAASGLTKLQVEAEKSKRAEVNKLRHEQRMQDFDKEIQGSYKRSVDDLRSSLERVSKFDSTKLYDGITSSLSYLDMKFRDTSGNATKLSSGFSILNKAVATVAAGVGIFASGMPAFQAMASTGVTFGGSLEKMQEMVGRSGLKLEEFQGIVSQFGTTIGGVGEQNFSKLVRGVQDSTRQFGLYGQTVGQQGEAVASFLDMLAKGGLAYGMSTDMQREGAVKYVRELTALTELTGKDRKELEARSKAAAEDAAIMLRIRQLNRTDPAAAQRLRANQDQIARTLGPEMARAIVGMQMGIMPSDPQMRAMMSIGDLMPSMTAMSRGLTTGTTEETLRSALDFQRALTESRGLDTLQLQAQVGGAYGGAAQMFAKMLPEAEKTQAAEARPGGLARIFDIFTGRSGNLDRATTAAQQITLDTARITGDFKAALYAATQQLGLFTKVLEPLAAATGVGAGAANSFYGMAASGISGAASAIATGAAVALMPKLLASTALKAAIPRLLGGGGLGLTSQLGSTGIMSSMMGGAGNLAARGGLLGMTGNRLLGSGLSRGILGGGLGGLAGGMAGAGLGSMLGFGSFGSGALGVLGGAAGGFLMGGPVGALVGGLGAALPMLISSASAAEANPGDQTGNAGGLLQDSTALVEMQASSTSYVSAMAALVSRVAAQATMTSLAPPMAPQNDALLGMVTTLNSTVAAQTPYIQDQARQARITAGIIGDFG